MPHLNTHVATRLSIEDYMEARTDRTGECWIWTGSKTWNGYGFYCLRGRRTRAHRVAYELAVGKIPPGLDIDHMCRTRLCVNPSHLQAVDRKSNNENRSNVGLGATGVRGVAYDKMTRKYEAYANHHNKKYSAGRFETIAGAAQAAQDLRLRLHVNNLADRVGGEPDGRDG